MRSPWFDGDWADTQSYGCTDFLEEGPNPHHPECEAFHDGIDLALDCGTAVYCPLEATCVQVGVNGGGPFALILDVGGWWVWLLHLEDAYVQPGQQVPAGALVGRSGTLGFSTGCHLHFEVTPAGGGYRDSVDPSGWLSSPLAALSAAVLPPWWGLSSLPAMPREGRAGIFRLAYWFLGRQPEMTPDGLGEHYAWGDRLAPDLANLDGLLIEFAAEAVREQASFPVQPFAAGGQLSPDQLRGLLIQLLGGKS